MHRKRCHSQFAIKKKDEKKRIEVWTVITSAGEELEARLVAEDFGSGGGRHLRDAEESEKIGHLDRDGRVGATNDAKDGTAQATRTWCVGPKKGDRAVAALVSVATTGRTWSGRRVHGAEWSADKFERPVESVRVPRASVDHIDTQFDARQEFAFTVDLIYCKEHRLKALDPAVINARSARRTVAFDMHWEETTQNDVSRQLYRLLLLFRSVHQKWGNKQ